MSSTAAEQRKAALDNLKFKRNNRPANNTASTSTTPVPAPPLASSSYISMSSSSPPPPWARGTPPAQSRNGAAPARFLPQTSTTGNVLVPNSSPLGPAPESSFSSAEDGEIPGLNYSQPSLPPPPPPERASFRLDRLTKPSGFVGAPGRTLAGTVRARDVADATWSSEPPKKRTNHGAPSSAPIAQAASPESPEVIRAGLRRRPAAVAGHDRAANLSTSSDDVLPTPQTWPTPALSARATPSAPINVHAKGGRSAEEETRFQKFRLAYISLDAAVIETAWIAVSGDNGRAAKLLEDQAFIDTKWKMVQAQQRGPPATTSTPTRAPSSTPTKSKGKQGDPSSDGVGEGHGSAPGNPHAKGHRSAKEEIVFNKFRIENVIYESGKVEAAWIAASGDSSLASKFVADSNFQWKTSPSRPQPPLSGSGEGRNKDVEEKVRAERAIAKERSKKSAIYAKRGAITSPEKTREDSATPARPPSPTSPEVVVRRGKRTRRLIESDDEEDDLPTPASDAPPPRIKRRVMTSEEPEDEQEDEVEVVTKAVPIVREPRGAPKTDAQRALEYFNTQSADLLRELTGCSEIQAAEIIKLRPFKSVADIKERLGQGKKKAGPAKISPRMFEDCVEIFEGYSAVDNVLDQCEDIGADLQARIARWTTGGKPSPSKGKDKAHNPALSADVWEDGALSLRSVAKTSKDFLSRQPKLIKEGVQLKEYQLLGLNWLRLMHQQGHSGILADEMGLGKTIQVISLFAHLHETGNKGPHLVCVPSSTLENWVREFDKFAPDIVVQTYYGKKEERIGLRADLLESMARDGKKNGWEVLVTTYNLASGDEMDKKFFRKVQWDSAVFDEGHMLKNCDSLKYKALIRFGGRWKLLLTGTPLQNNLQELVSLMNFIHPNILGPEMDALRAVFKTKGDSKVALLARNRVTRAKRMMTPFVLRRRKDQVLKDLPRKIERIEWCEMTPTQRQLYDAAVARSRKTALEVLPAVDEAPTTSKKKKAPSKVKEKKYLENSSNVLMDLRKASSHPMLFRVRFDDAVLEKISQLLVKEDDYKKYKASEVFEELSYWPDMELQRTCFMYKALKPFILKPDCLYTSGKVTVLLELIERYRKEDRKILIFSQFVQNLDILTAILDHEQTKHLILTGQTPVDQRQALCDEFTEDESIPVFLLSTKAGGMGINLTAASVVILFDQDFNPHNDRQAQDRAYRIGQKRDVDVIKLITRESIEEDMLRLGQTKLALDAAVAGDGSEEAGENVEKQLKTSLVDMLRKQAKEGGGTQTQA